MAINFKVKIDGQAFKPDFLELYFIDEEKQIYVGSLISPIDLSGLKSLEGAVDMLRLKAYEMKKNIEATILNKGERS